MNTIDTRVSFHPCILPFFHSSLQKERKKEPHTALRVCVVVTFKNRSDFSTQNMPSSVCTNLSYDAVNSILVVTRLTYVPKKVLNKKTTRVTKRPKSVS